MSEAIPHDADDDPLWRAVATRDRRLDGAFVYGVRSTGVFCRPSCPSRRPARGRVVFFPTPAAATAAGFRPCRRCRPETAAEHDPAARAVRRVCDRLAEAGEERPGLRALARAAGLSVRQLQRTFRKATGITVNQYADALRRMRFRQNLRDGDSVTGALYGAGYGSASRLYENAADWLGMTPGTYAKGGVRARIAFATAASPVGRLLVARTTRGLCWVSLGDDDDALRRALVAEFPRAAIVRDVGALADAVATVLALLDGRMPDARLPLDVRATAFRQRVWAALARVPLGATATYGEIAARLGKPGAARAVGRACATNPLAIVVPCHRAVAANGGLAGYRWGTARKRAILERERMLAAGGSSRPARPAARS